MAAVNKKQLPLEHPDFPHGTTTGYVGGCRKSYPCPAPVTCQQVTLRVQKRRELYPESGGQVSAAPVVAHVRALLQVPNANAAVIAAVAGISARTVQDMANHKRARLHRRSADKLMAVTREQVMAGSRREVTRKIVQMIRSMQAQGWTLRWQASRLDCSWDFLSKIISGVRPTITADLAARIHRLAASVELEVGPSKDAMAKARKQGWHALLAYDDDGNLIPGAVRDATNEFTQYRKERRNSLAHLRIRMLTMSLDGHGGPHIEDCLGLDGQQIERWRREAGLRFYINEHGMTAPRPECAERAAQLRAAFHAYWDVYPLQDPFELLRGLGMMLGRFHNIDPEDKDLIPQPEAGAEAEVAVEAEAAA